MNIYGINILVLIFASLALWVVLLIVESLKRFDLIKGENGRKAIHIFTGFVLALLPVIATRKEIVIINCMFLVGVLLFVGVLHRFTAIEDIKRWSWGQFLYPVGVLLVALLFKDPVIYSFAVLELALADGFAAVFGKRYGEITYHILGATKTALGSMVFLIITMTLFISYVSSYGTFDIYTFGIVLGGAISLTVIEGSIAGGFDNLFLPLATAAILSAL